jgi:SPP1 family predicted phage head-tail adaptor
MDASNLRHQVVRQTKSASSDGSGGTSGTWVDGTQYFAWVRPMTAREQQLANAQQVFATYVVTMRYGVPVAVTDRLKQLPSGPVLEVMGVRNVDGRFQWLELDCAAVI